MPLGIVSDDEFDSELGRIKSTGIVVDKPKLGRQKDSVETPESLRKIIGEESEINGRQAGLELGKQFNISSSSVSAYSNGATSTSSYNNPDRELKSHINQSKERIAKKASNKLISALNEITPEKLHEVSAKTASEIARNMSAIVLDMTPKVEEIKEDKGPTFVFYAPQIRSEDQFDVIDMSSE